MPSPARSRHRPEDRPGQPAGLDPGRGRQPEGKLTPWPVRPGACRTARREQRPGAAADGADDQPLRRLHLCRRPARPTPAGAKPEKSPRSGCASRRPRRRRSRRQRPPRPSRQRSQSARAVQVFVKPGRRNGAWSRSSRGLQPATRWSPPARTGSSTACRWRSTTPSTRPSSAEQAGGPAMSISDLFIRRPVLSTVLACMLLLLASRASSTCQIRAISEGRGNGDHHHHRLSGRQRRPDPGLHLRADRPRGRLAPRTSTT